MVASELLNCSTAVVSSAAHAQRRGPAISSRPYHNCKLAKDDTRAQDPHACVACTTAHLRLCLTRPHLVLEEAHVHTSQCHEPARMSDPGAYAAQRCSSLRLPSSPHPFYAPAASGRSPAAALLGPPPPRISWRRIWSRSSAVSSSSRVQYTPWDLAGAGASQGSSRRGRQSSRQ